MSSFLFANHSKKNRIINIFNEELTIKLFGQDPVQSACFSMLIEGEFLDSIIKTDESEPIIYSYGFDVLSLKGKIIGEVTIIIRDKLDLKDGTTIILFSYPE